MGISSPGIGSGLNVSSIVSQLVAADTVPLTALKAKEATFTTKISAYGSIKSAVSTLQTNLTTLVGSGLASQTATSSVPTAVGVSASVGATSGTYSIQINQLATQNKQISAGVTDPTALLGAGNLSIQIGSGAAISIPANNYSLQGVSDAINKANAGVSASIVNDGTTNHLIITSTKSGVANTATITASGGLAQFDTTSASTTKLAAQDAKLTIDGLAITKPSNQITDAIRGVTLNLQQVTTTPVTATVVRDDTTIKSNVASFVKAYNSVVTTVKGLTAYDPTTKQAAALTGDSGATSVLSSLRNEISKVVGSSGIFSSLASIGVTTQRDGTLAVDDTKLSKALTTDAGSVAQLFNNTDGVATRLKALTTNALADAGVIATRTNGYASSVKTLKTREDALIQQINAKQAQYSAQFSKLDTLLSGMQSTAGYLSQQLANLPHG